MDLPPFLRLHGNEVWLGVKVQPRAAKNEIGEAQEAELKIKVTAPPVDSAANEELIRFLAGRLNCSRSSLRLIRGNTSRHKVIAIGGVPVERIVELLSKDR
jgi:uncharacterized protein